MPTFFSLTITSLLTGALLVSCSQSSPTAADSTGSDALASSAKRATGTKVDSLSGIPGYRFGAPLSAFPGLAPFGEQEPGSQSCTYKTAKSEPGWFGKRRQEYPNEFYTYYVFADGKLVAFSATAYGDMRKALQEEAQYLYGSGVATLDGTLWKGEQAEAWTARSNEAFGPALTLLVRSKTFARQSAAAKADQLKKENAGQ